MMTDLAVQNGMYTLGTYYSCDIQSVVVLCFNDGTIVFNNFNQNNAASWTEKISMVGRDMSSGKFASEEWYKSYKRLLASGKITKEYCAMIDRMNRMEITREV